MNIKLDKVEDSIIFTVTLPLVTKSGSKNKITKNQVATLLVENYATDLEGYSFTSGNQKINNYEAHANTGTYVFTKKTAAKAVRTAPAPTTTVSSVTTDSVVPTAAPSKTRKKKTQK